MRNPFATATPGSPRRGDRRFDSPMVRHGLARELSRRGACSRSQAEIAVRDGRVRVDGSIVRDISRPCDARTRLEIDGVAVPSAPARLYLALHKPRGLVTSTRQERGAASVYALLQDAGLPWGAPVGRLDKASEGLLLLSNDSAWAAGITDPERHVRKIYRVQVRGVPDDSVLARMRGGVVDRGEHLAVASVSLLQSGGRTAWLECVLVEGRNRHLRRLLAALGFEVLRLMRIAIGPLVLGSLARGEWRELEPDEVRALAMAAGPRASRDSAKPPRASSQRSQSAATRGRVQSSVVPAPGLDR